MCVVPEAGRCLFQEQKIMSVTKIRFLVEEQERESKPLDTDIYD